MPSNDENKQIIDYREVGATGLRRFSGFVYNEFLPQLTGWRGIQVYQEMRWNDPVVWACLYAVEQMLRRTSWRVRPASSSDRDLEAADFLDTCINDMNTPWSDTIVEILSFLQFGHDAHEICYKRRCGDMLDPTMRSKHKDGRVGWRKLSVRSQDTIYRWQFDDHGGIQGFEQLAPPHYYHTAIPIEKLLLFRTTTAKNNPEGLSVLRGAYRPWYMKKNIENIEGIGIERDLAGLPVMWVPPEYLSSQASESQKNLLSGLRQIVTNVRRDEQEGLILPLAYDENGKQMFDFKLLTTGGTRQFDTDKTIQRYDRRIAMTMLADFILMGHENVGSFAMTSSKMNMFSVCLGSYADIISSVFNQYAVPRLFALNDFYVDKLPTLEHGDVESVDIKELGDYITKLAQAGYPLFPNDELERYLMNAAHLPEPPDPEMDKSLDIELPGEPEHKDVVEIPHNAQQVPTGLSQPSDTTPVNPVPPTTTVTNRSGDTEQNYWRK